MVLSTRFAPIALAIAPCPALGASVPVWPQPSGYDLLDRVRETYQRQGLRRDGGRSTCRIGRTRPHEPAGSRTSQGTAVDPTLSPRTGSR